jgi:TonB family protein
MIHLIMLQACFAVVAACAVKATAVFALAWIVTTRARRASAATRHQIWAIAIASALVLPVLQTCLPAWRAGAAGRAAELWGIASARKPSVSPPRLPSVTIDATRPSPWPQRTVEWLALIWALGFALATGRLAVGMVRVFRVSSSARPLFDEGFLRAIIECSRELGIARSVRLLTAEDPCAMPSTWGLAHPRILLPAGCTAWPAERRCVVLAHELAHIRRFDWPVRVAAEFARALYWFHPLAWLAARQVRDQSELACDDAVLASGVPADDYAGQLLDLVRTARTSAFHSAAALAVARPSNLERRFTAMLDTSLNRRGLTRNAALLTAAAALLLLVPLAALRAPAQDTAGRFSGAVFDPSGKPVSNATVIVTDAKNETKDMTVTNAAGMFQFGMLPDGEYEMKIVKEGFALHATPGVILESGRDATQNVTLDIAPLDENIDVTAAGLPKKQGTSPARIKVGANVQQANLVTKVNPVYPANTKAAGIQASVFLKAVISTEEIPLSLRVLNTEVDPDLARAAVEAVSQWRYRPTLLNGEPVETFTNITVKFTLSQ